MNFKSKLQISIIIFPAALIILAVFAVWPVFSSIKENSRGLVLTKNKLDDLKIEVENWLVKEI